MTSIYTSLNFSFYFSVIFFMQMKYARIGEQPNEIARCGAKHAIQARTARLIILYYKCERVCAARILVHIAQFTVHTNPWATRHCTVHTGVVVFIVRCWPFMSTRHAKHNIISFYFTVLLCDLRRQRCMQCEQRATSVVTDNKTE